MKGNKESLQKNKFSPRQKNHSFKTKKGSKNKFKKETTIDILKDDRFNDFTKPEKAPPVDMYGRPISADALENYVSSSDDDIEMIIPEDALPVEEEKIVVSKDISNRIAVQNQPWKLVSAQDLFQYFYLNMDDGHKEDLLSVKVVLSRFGQENPETEAPPPTDIEEVETARWRTREENELRRYFAICEFRDAYSANILYEKMENVEISEDKGGFFDLRFINDEAFKVISSFPLRDEAHEPVSDWTPPDVYCKFLTSTKNNDAWDSAPADRVDAHNRIWEIQDDDFDEDDPSIKQLIGSGSENEERPTRSQLEGTLSALEEEEMSESESDEENDIDVKFVEKEREDEQLLEKQDENNQNNKKGKRKRKEESLNDRNENDEETIKETMEDDRFQEFFAKPGYGIDPSDPSFKRTKLMEKYMDEVSKRHMGVNQNTDKDKKEEEHESNLIDSTVEKLRRRAEMRLKSNKKK